MIFTKSLNDAYYCEDWCDTKEDEALIGVISLSSDGYWRFNPARNIKMTCGHLKRIADKLSELNGGKE
jgi:hypothetical protein